MSAPRFSLLLAAALPLLPLTSVLGEEAAAPASPTASGRRLQCGRLLFRLGRSGKQFLLAGHAALQPRPPGRSL